MKRLILNAIKNEMTYKGFFYWEWAGIITSILSIFLFSICRYILCINFDSPDFLTLISFIFFFYWLGALISWIGLMLVVGISTLFSVEIKKALEGTNLFINDENEFF